MGLIIFLSYSHRDAAQFQISRIARELSREPQFDDILYSQRDVHENFIKYMNDTLSQCHVVILFCSQISMASEYVEAEWTAAKSMKIPIIPVYRHLEEVPPLLRPHNAVPFLPEDMGTFLATLKDAILKATYDDLTSQQKLNTKFKSLIKTASKIKISEVAKYLNLNEKKYSRNWLNGAKNFPSILKKII